MKEKRIFFRPSKLFKEDFINNIPPGTAVQRDLNKEFFATTIGGLGVYEGQDDYVSVKDIIGPNGHIYGQGIWPIREIIKK